MDRIFTVEDVAAYLKVEMITVRIWLRDGKLKGHKIGKAWRIYKSDLEAFINRS